MPITPPRRGDQTYDGLLAQDDLPEGWYLPDRFPGEREDDASNEIDTLLGYDDSLVTDQQRQSQAASDENETIDINAPGGMVDYANRYGGFYARLAQEPAGPEVFSADNAEKIAATWPKDRSPDAIRTRQDRRDARLAALRRHLASEQS